MNEIEVKHVSLRMSKRAGELYAKHLWKTKSTFKRILPDFIIGAHAGQYGDAFVTWNPSDYDKHTCHDAELSLGRRRMHFR